jgi:hypothetical protein
MTATVPPAQDGASDVPVDSSAAPDGEAPGTRHIEIAPATRTGKGIIKCSATTKAGRACTNAAGPDGHCIAHSRSPQTLATLQAARAAGGRAPRVRVGLAPAVVDAVDLHSSDGQLAVLTAATRALAQGSISSTTATAISQLVRTAAGIVAADQERAIAELQKRIDALVIDASPRGR